jgi:hypothetical protein
MAVLPMKPAEAKLPKEMQAKKSTYSFHKAIQGYTYPEQDALAYLAQARLESMKGFESKKDGKIVNKGSTLITDQIVYGGDLRAMGGRRLWVTFFKSVLTHDTKVSVEAKSQYDALVDGSKNIHQAWEQLMVKFCDTGILRDCHGNLNKKDGKSGKVKQWYSFQSDFDSYTGQKSGPKATRAQTYADCHKELA